MGINFGLESEIAATPSQSTTSSGGGSSPASSGGGSGSGLDLQNNPFEGLKSTQSLASIRAAEAAAKAARRTEANSIFDPEFARTKATGEETVGTVIGGTGQRQGFNLSTQSAGLVNKARENVDLKLKEVQDRKQSYIESGDLAAAQKADEQEQLLFSQSLQILQAQTTYALNQGQAQRAERGLALQEEAGVRDEAKFGFESTTFMQGQEERTAGNLSSGLVDLDAEGNVTEPTFEDIQAIANENGIDANVLMSNVNARIDAVKKIAIQDRQAALNEMQILSNIARTKFLSDSEAQMLPYQIKEKQASIDQKLAAAAKSNASIANLGMSDFGITSVEVLGDLQSATNQLNQGIVDLNQVPEELQPFIQVSTNVIGDLEYRLNEPTTDQYETIVNRRAQNIQTQILLERSILADLNNDPTSEGYKSTVSSLSLPGTGFTPETASKIVSDVAKKNNIQIDTGDAGANTNKRLGKGTSPVIKQPTKFGYDEAPETNFFELDKDGNIVAKTDTFNFEDIIKQ